MDVETLRALIGCTFIAVIILLIRSSQKKKKIKAAEKEREEKLAKAEEIRLAEKKAAASSEKKPAASTEKKAGSRIKADPAFSAAGALSDETPKPAPVKREIPKPKKKAASHPSSEEMEVLLQAEQSKESCWICRYCSVENQKNADRCMVCGELK